MPGQGPNIQSHPALRHTQFWLDNLLAGIGGKSVCGHHICRQQELDSPLFRFCHQLPGQFQLILLHLGLAKVAALGGQEGVGHAPANEQGINLGQKVADDANFIRDLGTANDGYKGPAGNAQYLAQHLDFPLHQQASIGRQVIGNTYGAGMGSVGCAKGVIDKYICQFRQFFGKLRIILFFTGIKADIFQKEHIPVIKGCYGCLRFFANGRVHLCYRDCQQFFQPPGNGIQTQLFLDSSLGAAQMRNQHQPGSLPAQEIDGGQGSTNPGIIGDFPCAHGHVKVNPEQHPLASKFGGLNRFALHSLYLHPLDLLGCYSFLATIATRSTTLAEYPHSLSYQATTFAILSITVVDRASTTPEYSDPL